jgi:hypothetical protein
LKVESGKLTVESWRTTSRRAGVAKLADARDSKTFQTKKFLAV